MSPRDVTDAMLQAAGKGEYEEVQALLRAGVSPNTKNRIGYTPLMSAARSYRVSVVELLLKSGADPRSCREDGLTALHCAVGETPSDPRSQADCVSILLAAGANVNAATDTGLTPLMNAAWFGCGLALSELLNAGADRVREDQQGRTAAEFARMKGRNDIAGRLDLA